MPRKSIFQFPKTLSRDGSITSSTRALYRSKINSIAKITERVTVQDMLEHPLEVIGAIKQLAPEDDKNVKMLRRILMSAVMYVLCDIPYEKRTEYYKYYLTLKDPYDPLVAVAPA
jgi:hypothetical protein